MQQRKYRRIRTAGPDLLLNPSLRDRDVYNARHPALTALGEPPFPFAQSAFDGWICLGLQGITNHGKNLVCLVLLRELAHVIVWQAQDVKLPVKTLFP